MFMKVRGYSLISFHFVSVIEYSLFDHKFISVFITVALSLMSVTHYNIMVISCIFNMQGYVHLAISICSYIHKQMESKGVLRLGNVTWGCLTVSGEFSVRVRSRWCQKSYQSMSLAWVVPVESTSHVSGTFDTRSHVKKKKS